VLGHGGGGAACSSNKLGDRAPHPSGHACSAGAVARHGGDGGDQNGTPEGDF
jgi:hypothetical protein